MLNHVVRKLPRAINIPSRSFFKISPAQEERVTEYLVKGIFGFGSALVCVALAIMAKEIVGKSSKKQAPSKEAPDCAQMLKMYLDMNQTRLSNTPPVADIENNPKTPKI